MSHEPLTSNCGSDSEQATAETSPEWPSITRHRSTSRSGPSRITRTAPSPHENASTSDWFVWTQEHENMLCSGSRDREREACQSERADCGGAWPTCHRVCFCQARRSHGVSVARRRCLECAAPGTRAAAPSLRYQTTRTRSSPGPRERADETQRQTPYNSPAVLCQFSPAWGWDAQTRTPLARSKSHETRPRSVDFHFWFPQNSSH